MKNLSLLSTPSNLVSRWLLFEGLGDKHVSTMTYAESVGIRLPTEAEWERTARGGLEGTDYSFGNIEEIDITESTFYSDDTVRIGLTPENNYGLYDMCGNVCRIAIPSNGQAPAG